MTEISFYHLHSTPLEGVLPKLLEKALSLGKRAVVLVPSEERLEKLNTLLWTYSTRTFLPHGSEHDPFRDEQPIYLTTREENPNNAEILLITDGAEPSFIGSFERCLDLFDGADAVELGKARGRWRRYKEQHTVNYWQQAANGGWEKK